MPLVGDWNGDGIDTPGMYDPATATFYLTNRLEGGDADHMFDFGIAGQGWKPLVGDWDGDGRDSIGVYEPTTSLFFFKNTFAPGDADEMVPFGIGGLGWQPIIGDWDGLPGDGFGFYEPATSLFFLKNAHTPGDAEEFFPFGMGNLGWVPVGGQLGRHAGRRRRVLRPGYRAVVPEERPHARARRHQLQLWHRRRRLAAAGRLLADRGECSGGGHCISLAGCRPSTGPT